MSSSKRRIVKRQKLEEDAEKEELKGFLDIIPREEFAEDVESLSTKYPIVDWKTYTLTENFMYYQIFRGDGSSKNYKVLSEMLEDFDRQDVEELYRLVKERYSASRPEGYDLMLWGDLHTLFEPDEEDEIWKNQHEYNVISWSLYDFCGIHILLMQNGIAIHMLTEKKYPLSQEMISKMLKKKLEVDHESSQAFELLRFIRSQDDPQKALKNKGIVNSGCSRHMTGNKAYLVEYQDYNGGSVAFGGSKGQITGKLDFKDVYFVKELKQFNLFSVSQICDKKNKVLFTDSECLVLSPDFKLPDENQVLLRVPRQNNMYSLNLENIVPTRGLACLIAKATVDESNKWHRRLGHKGKQQKGSCKAKVVSFISQPLQLLHMDLFGPTSVRTINHKTYCLVITDDFSKFSWVFFLRTKDETSGILKDFIRQIENQLNKKVKTIRCDNGTKFKNRDINEFCGSKGIKREYSNARTPQQNGVTKRKNRTLIEAARTMLANSFLPNTF
ncbi:putative ribonuclease H-like domain-containing protein [Tanacetum coccineum]